MGYDWLEDVVDVIIAESEDGPDLASGFEELLGV